MADPATVRDQPLRDWSDSAGAQTRLQQTGRWMLRIGAALLIVGMFLTPPWGLFGLAIGGAGLLVCHPPWPARSLFWCGGLLGGWVALSVLLNVLLGQPGAGRISSVAYTWLAIIIVGVAGLEAAWRRSVLRIAIATAVAAGIVASLQFFIGLGDGPLRISTSGHPFWMSRGFSATHLTYGFVAGLLAIICFQPSAPQDLGRAWMWIGRGATVWGATICGSRAASLAMACAVAASCMLRGRRALLIGLAVGALLVSLILARMLLTDAGRIQRMLAGDDGRWRIWQVSAEVISDNPLIGIGGRRGFPAIYNEHYLRLHGEAGSDFDAPHAHNWFLTLAAEHGIPALLLQALLLSLVLRFCWMRRTTAPAGWNLAASATGLALLSGMFEPFPVLAVPGLSFHAVLGLAVGLAVRNQVDSPPKNAA